MGELYKIVKKNPEEETQHLSRPDLLEKVQQNIEKHKDALALWPTNSAFGEFVQIYENYMTIKYGKPENICVVLDGYTTTSSTEGEEHSRRAIVVAASANVIMRITAEREEFLRNTANKVHFIDFLVNVFKREKINVIQNDADTDVMIVTEASSR